ncbi:MAG TPA: hypothetical protein VGN83_12630 [Falsiroseomonas sp.]|nr:hypothetical protein [Falsiroseomonas sp.]
MQPTSTTASFSQDELSVVLLRDADGQIYQLVREPLDKNTDIYKYLTATLAPRTMVAFDRNDRAFRLGSFDGNGVDGTQLRLPSIPKSP